MAENNPGDILTCDWNPFVGCERTSPGCARCWFLDGIFPWQQRLGNIPADQRPDQPLFLEKRLSADALKGKNGIVGVCQHGDLFWDSVTDTQVHEVLDVIDEVAPAKIAKRLAAGRPAPKYVLWTKRVGRMRRIMEERYRTHGGSHSVPEWYGLGASVESQRFADQRLPDLLAINGFRIAVLEPILSGIDLAPYVAGLDWVVVGSETGEGCRPAQLDWFRALRDVTVAAGKPFFIKQHGTSHKAPERALDGRMWDEFPAGYVKRVKGIRAVVRSC